MNEGGNSEKGSEPCSESISLYREEWYIYEEKKYLQKSCKLCADYHDVLLRFRERAYDFKGC